MRKVIGLFILHCLTILSSPAQQIGREQVYIHLNSQSFISGETIYLSAYCNLMSGQPSDISKVLYIEIVGEKGPIHQQKIQLNNGRGHSDFFIPSMIPSGQYYLLAYTRWMKNFDDFFQCPVKIINPFETYPDIEEISEADITFYPLHNPLVAGVENVVAFKIKADDPTKFKGRIINNDGETITTFGSDHFGLGKLMLLPNSGQVYQALMEDDMGNIQFFELPQVKDTGNFILYQDNNARLSLKCEMAGSPVDTLKVTIISNDSIIYQSEALPNSYHHVAKSIIQEGIFKIQYTCPDDSTIAERFVFIAPPILKKSQISKTYGFREKVWLDTGLDSGNYSISVRKIINSDFDSRRHAIWNGGLNPIMYSPVSPSAYLSYVDRDLEAFILASTFIPATETLKNVTLLPEIREEILLGSIIDSAGNPAPKQKIALTLPGNPFQLRFGESDEQGNFFIPFQSSVTDLEAMLSAVDFNNSYRLKVKNAYWDHYPKFDFKQPRLNNELIKEIIDRSIRVQIENAYFIFSGKKTETNWIGEIPYHYFYILDEYRRFPTLRETFTEYIVSANVRVNRDYAIKTVYSSGLFKSDFPPLILLDGVPVNGKDVININPYKVNSIGVLPNRYFMGPMVIDGLVSIATFNRDYGDFQFDLGGNHEKILIMKVAANGSYEFSDYEENGKAHLADQREQLFWKPNFKPVPGNSEFSFYTSDVPGEYEIVIEGFTDRGKPLTMIINFRVQ